MKLRLMPLVASLCGLFLCASVAQANSVFIRNKPVAHVVTINHTVYVPFAELMNGLQRSWSVDAQGNVSIKHGGDRQELTSANFTLHNGDKEVKIAGVMREGQVWVPVRIVRDLGYDLSYNPLTEIVDIITPRLINDTDRQAEAEVAANRAALAEQKAAENAALEERKLAMAELKAKKAKGEAGADTTKAEEGAYDPNFEAEQLAAAKKVEAKQKDFGPVETYSDLMRVQQQLDEQDAARRAALRQARQAEAGEEDGETAAAAPAPTPNLVVFAPRATPDYFTGHINMTATVRNIGTEMAKSCTATMSLVAPDGTVLYTQRMSNASVDVNGQWALSTGYDHIAGAEMPRGMYQVRVVVDCANKAAKK